MGKIYRTKIFRRLFISFLSVAIANFVALYLVIYFRTQAFIDARELEMAVSYEQQVSQRLMEWLEEQEEAVVQLASHLAIDLDSGLGETLFDRRIAACRESQDSFSDVFSADPEGRMTHLSSSVSTPRIDVSDRGYFRASMKGEVFASGFFVERIHGSLSLAVSAPILAAGSSRPAGIAAGLLRFEEVSKVIEGLSALNDLGSVLVLDSRSRRLASSIDAEVGEAPLSTRAALELAAGRSGSARYLDVSGELVYGSYAWLEDLGLGLVIELSARKARGPLVDILKFVALFAGLVVVAFAVDSWALSLRLLRPIGKLSDAAEKLAKDIDPGPLLMRTGTELDGIGACFDRMAEAVRVRESELKDSAARDSLTGLYNHAMIEERLAHELSGRRKSDRGFPTLIMVDLDHFKDVNDTYGHGTGDEVLRALATILGRESREDDFLGRYGGEEFSIILRDREREAVMAYCERLRASVAAVSFRSPAGRGGSERFSVTASFGWAQALPGIDSPSELIKRADAGLYAAKAAGRNCVREGAAPSLQKAPNRG